MAKKAIPEWIQHEVEELACNPMQYLRGVYGDVIELGVRKRRWHWDKAYYRLDPVEAKIYKNASENASDSAYRFNYRMPTGKFQMMGEIYDAWDGSEIEHEWYVGWYLKPDIYTCKLKLKVKEVDCQMCPSNTGSYMAKKESVFIITGTSVSAVTRETKLTADTYFLNVINGQFRQDFPYVYQDSSEDKIPRSLYYLAPQIEQLWKAGYQNLVNELIQAFQNGDKSAIECFNRLTKPASDIRTIFKTEKNVYKNLKDENISLSMWDVCRKLVKGGKINADSINEFVRMPLRDAEYKIMYHILGFKYNDKPVFSFDSLMTYLGRLDTYEALEGAAALEHLDDYLTCCDYLKIKPNIESDSLVREHNVAARLCRETRQEKMNAALNAACLKLQEWNYAEGPYLIRGVQSYDDLMDEAIQQHNCVACFSREIAAGKRKIFFMRRAACPDKSWITVEVSLDGKSVLRKATAYNGNVHDGAQTEFLKHWIAYIGQLQKQKTA